MSGESGPPSKSRLVLLLLMLLFFGPLLAAFVLYYGTHWRPAGQTNHGALIQPPRALPTTAAAAVLRGKWSLVYVGAGNCDAECRSTLYFIRQSYLGMAQLMPRMQQVFLVTAACCDDAFIEREHPQLITVNLESPDDTAAAALLAQFPSDQRASTVFIVDPKGNLMMRYDAHATPKGLHEDLQKLLNLSHIG
jgi:cytochrome oxidase Cu insertion factor (SCO1/SenC/PrrC family)